MGLESPLNYWTELNTAWPLDNDPRSEGDDHIRAIKRVLKNTFPNFVGTSTAPASCPLSEDDFNNIVSAIDKTVFNAWTGDNTFTAGIYPNSFCSFWEGCNVTQESPSVVTADTHGAQTGIRLNSVSIYPMTAFWAEFNRDTGALTSSTVRGDSRIGFGFRTDALPNPVYGNPPGTIVATDQNQIYISHPYAIPPLCFISAMYVDDTGAYVDMPTQAYCDYNEIPGQMSLTSVRKTGTIETYGGPPYPQYLTGVLFPRRS